MPDGCRGPPAAPSQRPPHGRSGAGPDRSCALRTATRGCPAQQCGGGASQPRQPLLSNGNMPWAALMDRHTGPAAPAVTNICLLLSGAQQHCRQQLPSHRAHSAWPWEQGRCMGQVAAARLPHARAARGGHAGGSTSSQRRSSCRRASSRMLSPKYVPQPVDRWRWHSVSSTRAFGSPSTCAAPVHRRPGRRRLGPAQVRSGARRRPPAPVTHEPALCEPARGADGRARCAQTRVGRAGAPQTRGRFD